ncbi:MAG: copper transporter [Actinomycetota bacterium]|nr:copper transporter [Actinomycetota bacterium]
MINFRYHLISLVAVFLALAVGVVMGSAVIDKAVVESLEDQQRIIAERVDQAIAENEGLQAELSEVQDRSQRLSDEATPRLLADRLGGVPVLVLATRGVASEAIDATVALLDTAGAEHEGTLWFTDRLTLDTDEERRDLARALGRSEGLADTTLRAMAIDELAEALTTDALDGPGEGPPGLGGAPDAPADPVAELRDAGFVDFDPPEGAETQTADLVTTGARILFVSGPGAVLDDTQWAQPLASALVGEAPQPPSLSLLVAESYAPGTEGQASLTAALRGDDALSTRLSTVNRIDDFAGQLAVVLALEDLGQGRVGHYGRDAQRLIPAPAE